MPFYQLSPYAYAHQYVLYDDNAVHSKVKEPTSFLVGVVQNAQDASAIHFVLKESVRLGAYAACYIRHTAHNVDRMVYHAAS